MLNKTAIYELNYIIKVNKNLNDISLILQDISLNTQKIYFIDFTFFTDSLLRKVQQEQKRAIELKKNYKAQLLNKTISNIQNTILFKDERRINCSTFVDFDDAMVFFYFGQNEFDISLKKLLFNLELESKIKIIEYLDDGTAIISNQ